MISFKTKLVVASCMIALSACNSTLKQEKNNEVVSKAPEAKVKTELPKVSQQPNILWIVTDDQRADSIAAYNMSQTGKAESPLGYVSSPSIDKLASEGTMFTHAYTNSPACAPSRSSMQFGLYPHHSGRFGFEYFHNQHDLAMPTTSQTLSEQGYQTVLFGKRGVRYKKWQDGGLKQEVAIYDEKIDYSRDLGHQGHNNGKEPKLFTDYSRQDTFDKSGPKWVKLKSDEVYVFPDGRIEKIDQNDIDVNNPTAVEKELDILRSYTRSQKNLIIGGVSPKPAGETLDGYILKAFVEHLRQPNTRYDGFFGRKIQGPDLNKPQMFNLGFHFPHTPVLPPKSFRDQFKGKTYKVPEFSQAEVEKLPKQMKALYKNLKIDGLTPEQKQQAIADYYAFCAYGDWLIGQAIDEFKKFSQQQGRDYVIMVTVGDHGWQLGEQGIEAKFSPWNTSNQGIIVVADSRAERFPKGVVYSDFVEYVDIAPTLLAASGLDVKASKPQLDGVDLAEVIRKPELTRDYVIGELNAVVGPRAYLRSKNFAFSMRVRKENGFPGKGYAPGENVYWAYNASNQDLEMGLYDLRCDANEQNNIAYQANYKQVTEYFRKKLTDIVIGDGRVEIDWRKPNSYFVSDAALGAHDKKLAGLANIELPSCM
ncbi:sulfatase [Catenovulum agarivorans DS-2]|uniref:Sulfatase n=1 Tax=Catenovulum agarivorans DS-2 TaxID=1328313 RepID=W7QZE4_9ALTE|nr:sulfatase-like hydrolase/transferase [Catenovulum agarivorans]EWH10725.1 sulfatase [Catenovulum agarivorans DS-2]